MTKKSQPRSDTRAKAEAMRREQARAERRSRVLFWSGTAAAVLAVAGLVTWGVIAGSRASQIEGARTFENLERDHVTEPAAASALPPAGGKHNGTPQNCGVYSAPVATEHAIHSMEHGAVWITYQPGLPADQVATLDGYAKGQTHILVSPYPGLASPVVATAWGTQVELPGAEDPRLAAFVKKYQNGKQTPEPGAACSGGVGTPQTPSS